MVSTGRQGSVRGPTRPPIGARQGAGRARRLAALAALAAGVVLAVLPAVPASAHPGVAGGEIPVDSLATITLAMAHGCDSEDADAGEPTTEVALEVPDWLRIVEVPETDPWTVELEHATDDGSVVETVVWATDDPQVVPPSFELDVVADGEVGDERYLSVFQGCETGSYRWVGTPDEPADDPAVRVVLAEPDPDAPPPPELDPGSDEGSDQDAGGGADDPATDDPADAGDEPDDASDDPADEASSEQPDDEDAAADEDTAADEDAAADEAPQDAGVDDPEAAAAADDSGGPPWGVIVAVLVLLAALGAILALWTRRGAATGPG